MSSTTKPWRPDCKTYAAQIKQRATTPRNRTPKPPIRSMAIALRTRIWRRASVKDLTIRQRLVTPVQPQRGPNLLLRLRHLPVLDSLRLTTRGNSRGSTNQIPSRNKQQILNQRKRRLSPSQTQSLAISRIAGKDPTLTLFVKSLNHLINRHVLSIFCTYNVSSRLFHVFILLPSLLNKFFIFMSIDFNLIRNSRLHVHHRIVLFKIGLYFVMLFLECVQSGGRVAFQGLSYLSSIDFRPEDYCWQLFSVNLKE